MRIKYYGRSAFGMEEDGVSVLADPSPSQSQLEADVATFSASALSQGFPPSEKSRILDWPGEFEAKGVHFKRLHSLGGLEGAPENIITLFYFKGFKVCHLGYQREKLSEAQVEQIGDVDILIVPVGGGNVLGAKQAKAVAEQVDPRVVIPMLYAAEQETGREPVEAFLGEMGASGMEALAEFKAKRSELPEDSFKVVLLAAQG